jgi:nucleoside-diphosphate-sugar epimerase
MAEMTASLGKSGPASSVLVTGAAGFVGRELCSRLLAKGWSVRGAIRSERDSVRLRQGVDPVVIGSIGPDTSWEKALRGMRAVVHLAARAHVMSDDAIDSLAAYREVNVLGTQRLVEASMAAGIERFVFLSSIKVNGEGAAEPYNEHDAPRPEDPYGVSKWEAEQVLWRSSAGSERMVPVVLRSPLVYGPGVRANFLKLMGAVNRGLPFPVASIRNRRSLIFVGNLADAISLCLSHPGAKGRTYLVCDAEDVSTGELVRRIARSLDRPARVFAFPTVLLEGAARLLGRKAAAKRLLGTLAVDSSSIRHELSWTPPYSMAEGLKETSAWFRGEIAS